MNRRRPSDRLDELDVQLGLEVDRAQADLEAALTDLSRHLTAEKVLDEFGIDVVRFRERPGQG